MSSSNHNPAETHKAKCLSNHAIDFLHLLQHTYHYTTCHSSDQMGSLCSVSFIVHSTLLLQKLYVIYICFCNQFKENLLLLCNNTGIKCLMLLHSIKYQASYTTLYASVWNNDVCYRTRFPYRSASIAWCHQHSFYCGPCSWNTIINSPCA